MGEAPDLLLPDHEPLERRVPLAVGAVHLRGAEVLPSRVVEEDRAAVHSDELRSDPDDRAEDLLEVRETRDHLGDPEERGEDLLVSELPFGQHSSLRTWGFGL